MKLVTNGPKVQNENKHSSPDKIGRLHVLKEQEMLETITQQMVEPKHGNTVEHRRDMKVYQAYKRKDRVARILLLSSMRNDIMLRFERHRSAQAI